MNSGKLVVLRPKKRKISEFNKSERLNTALGSKGSEQEKTTFTYKYEAANNKEVCLIYV